MKRITRKTQRESLINNILILSIFINAVMLGVFVVKPWITGILTKRSEEQKAKVEQKSRISLFDEINPEKGYDLKIGYGSLGPNLIKSGAIDPDKFTKAYESSGQKLSPELKDILVNGSNKSIVINRDNSYFLLNFFWAVGLANKSPILTEGDMVKQSQGQVGNFASTGGWTLSQKEAMNYYAQSNLIPLTADQEKLVETTASQMYRPCCNNSTAFPDCNHGMALLGVMELMAANGATEDQMFSAAKYINAYWFPSNYYDIALYFKSKEGKKFSEIDPKELMGREFSSASGWQKLKKWLVDNGKVETPPTQGSSCGV